MGKVSDGQIDMFALPVPSAPAAPEPVAVALAPESVQLNAVYGEYLEHSIRYYLLDSPVVPDSYFDKLCQALLAGWALVTHRHKHMSDESALNAGTGFQLPFHQLDHIVWLCRQNPGQPLKSVFNLKPSEAAA